MWKFSQISKLTQLHSTDTREITPVPTFAAVTSIPQTPTKQNFENTPYCTCGEKEQQQVLKSSQPKSKVECEGKSQTTNSPPSALPRFLLMMYAIVRKDFCLSQCNLQSVVVCVPILICWPCLPKSDVMAGMHPRPRFYGSLFLTVFLSGFLHSFHPPLSFSVVARRHLSLSGRSLFIVRSFPFLATWFRKRGKSFLLLEGSRCVLSCEDSLGYPSMLLRIVIRVHILSA